MGFQYCKTINGRERLFLIAHGFLFVGTRVFRYVVFRAVVLFHMIMHWRLEPNDTRRQYWTRMNFFFFAFRCATLHYESKKGTGNERENKMMARSVEPALAGLSHVLLTRRHHLRLLRDFLQSAQHDAVASRETVDHVLDLRLGAELLHERLQPAEIVTRYAREEVVHGLELQAAVDEVEPLRAGDVHRCAELALRERLAGAEIRGAGAPVGEGDLHVQGHGD